MTACLDSFALLAWLAGEGSAHIVTRHLEQGDQAGSQRCTISAINLGEVYYLLARRIGPDAAEETWRSCVDGVVPLTVVRPTLPRIRAAARVKARFPLAYADAFAVATARELGLPLLTGDPEIGGISDEAGLEVIWLER